jgi:hypothetical protein
MNVDRQGLRQLAQKLRSELSEAQLAWTAHQAFVQSDDFDSTEIAEVLEPQEHRWMLAEYIAAVPPPVVLELLDRLERAEQKLREAHERVTDSRDYRDEMLALLDSEAP